MKLLNSPRFIVKVTFFCAFILLNLQASAAVIQAPKDVCLGNLAYFDIKAQGFSACRWDFGDGYTSVSKAPFHLYKSAGVFNVKVELKLNGGGTLLDSVLLKVHHLPNAKLYLKPDADTCLYTNLFNFIDSSTAANGNNIIKRLTVWGDGSFDIDNTPYLGESFSHHYKMRDVYKIKVEVTDDKGCKNSAIANVKVIHGTKAKIEKEITYPSCKEAQVCFKNASESSNSNQTYLWNIDSAGWQSLNYNTISCIKTTKTRKVYAQLILSNPDNTCMTKDSVEILLNADSISNTISINDSVFCYGSGMRLDISNSGGPAYHYTWLLDGRDLQFNAPNLLTLPKGISAAPGKHQIICNVEKGPCKASYTLNFRVKGPVARMKIYNQKQCGIDKKVFFIDTSLNLNKKHALYNWTVIDPDGDNCVINRSINQNKYKNCNYGRDWFGKHNYTTPRGSNPIILSVTDTSVGCSDSTVDNMEHFHCRLCVRSGGIITICQGDTFLPLRDKEIGPKYFSLDTGKTWLDFPSQINKPYKGLYGVSFIFENREPERAEDFGDDSIKIYRSDSFWMDTVFADNFLWVNETMDTALTLKINNICNPFEAEVEFVNPHFIMGDKVSIDWKDGQTTEIFFDKDSVLKSVKHIYRLIGLDTMLSIGFTSHEGCFRSRNLRIRFGKGLFILRHGKECIRETICFSSEIDNFNNDTNYNRLKSQTWFSEYRKSGYKGDLYCDKFTKNDSTQVMLVAEDQYGCVDTLRQDLFIRELKAGILSDSRISFCSELKQFFDSSYFVSRKSTDRIIEYYWDFGSGMYTTLEQNPFRSFDLEDSIINTLHIVEDNNGCRDTVQFNIRVIGSIPKFTMTDTIGCSPLIVSFKNTSKRCSSYIWEYGDWDNTTMEDRVKKDQTFKYLKPGKYYPKLIGIDTFYNPYTGAVYYCHETFDPKNGITVYDTKFTRFNGPDTICLGETATFTCESNVNNVKWDFGDKPAFNQSFNANTKHTYTKKGNYVISYKPVYTFGTGEPVCLDSSVRTIAVIGVEADFEIKSESKAPIFKFKNLSDPSYADLKWDFGDPASGSKNSSTVQNPIHNYEKRNGRYNVCLTASIFNKCKDSICKPILNDYSEYITLYNVFTPGTSTGFNDDYEVSIEGEEHYHLTIYDRWGVVVYESFEDAEPGDGNNWNGKVKNTGPNCSDGTYYYIFEYSFAISPDTRLKTNGTITLIRK